VSPDQAIRVAEMFSDKLEEFFCSFPANEQPETDEQPETVLCNEFSMLAIMLLHFINAPIRGEPIERYEL
jgi:hypothetical protein